MFRRYTKERKDVIERKEKVRWRLESIETKQLMKQGNIKSQRK